MLTTSAASEFSKMLDQTYKKLQGEKLTKFDQGDTVSVTFEGKIVPGNGGEYFDIMDTGNGEVYYNVPRKYLTLVKKATPPEPPVGTLIKGTYGTVFQRKDKGWVELHEIASTFFPNTRVYQWGDFAHNLYKVLGEVGA